MIAFDGILHQTNGATVELNKTLDGFSAVREATLKCTFDRYEYKVLTVTIERSATITFNSGDYVEVNINGATERLYYFYEIGSYEAKTDRGGIYTVDFVSGIYMLHKAMMYATSEVLSGGSYTWTRPTNDYLTLADLRGWMQAVAYNANSVQGRRVFLIKEQNGGYDAFDNDLRVFTFSDANCLNAMAEVLENYGVYLVVEYSSNDDTYTLSIKTDITSVGTLKYEAQQGLTLLKLGASDREVYTMFVVLGGTENLPSGYAHTRLEMDDNGSMLTYPDLYSRYGRNLKELVYDDIKPTFTGVITGTTSNILEFTCSALQGIEWSPLNGQINIVDGDLIGYSFNCVNFDSTTGKVTVDAVTENEFSVPNAEDTTYRFVPRMKFNITGVSLPEAYLTAAQTKLQARAEADADKLTQPRATYEITIDPKELIANYPNGIKAGDGLTIIHQAIGVNAVLKVTSISYDALDNVNYAIKGLEVSNLEGKSVVDVLYGRSTRATNSLRKIGIDKVVDPRSITKDSVLNAFAMQMGYEDYVQMIQERGNSRSIMFSKEVAGVMKMFIRAGLVDIETLIADQIFIGGVEDIAEDLVNNYSLLLSNEVITVAATSDGTVTAGLPATCNLSVMHGSSLDTGWTFAATFNDCTGTLSNGVVTITAITTDSASVSISASKEGAPALSATINTVKQKAGAAGSAGTGISSTIITYQASTSGTEAPSGTWSETIPTVPDGQYLWTRTVVAYTDNTSSTSYSISKNGESIEATGGWDITKTYKKGEVVSWAGGSFVAKHDTFNAPLLVMQDDEGSYIQDGNNDFILVYVDGKYVVNTDDWYTLSEKGDEGEAADYVYLTASTQLVKYNYLDVCTPSTVTFSAYHKVGSKADENYAGRFVVTVDGVNVHTSNVDEVSWTYTVPATAKVIVGTLFRAGGGGDMLDSATVNVVMDEEDIKSIATNWKAFLQRAKEGSTTLEGGYLKTVLIEVATLIAKRIVTDSDGSGMYIDIQRVGDGAAQESRFIMQAPNNDLTKIEMRGAENAGAFLQIKNPSQSAMYNNQGLSMFKYTNSNETQTVSVDATSGEIELTSGFPTAIVNEKKITLSTQGIEFTDIKLGGDGTPYPANQLTFTRDDLPVWKTETEWGLISEAQKRQIKLAYVYNNSNEVTHVYRYGGLPSVANSTFSYATHAATSGEGSSVGGTRWQEINNALGSSSSYAWCNRHNYDQYLFLSFSLSVPNDATVTHIKLECYVRGAEQMVGAVNRLKGTLTVGGDTFDMFTITGNNADQLRTFDKDGNWTKAQVDSLAINIICDMNGSVLVERKMRCYWAKLTANYIQA